MLPEPKISYKPFWGICRPLNSWRANSPNPIQIYCAPKTKWFLKVIEKWFWFEDEDDIDWNDKGTDCLYSIYMYGA